MKKIALFHIFLLIFALFSNFQPLHYCFAKEITEEDLGVSIQEEIDKIDFSVLDEYLQESGISNELFDGNLTKDLVLAIVNGELKTDIVSVFEFLILSIKNDFSKYISSLLVVVVIVLLCSLFNAVKFDGSKNSVEKLIQFICFSLVITIVVRLSSGIISQSVDSILNMQKQMNVIFPILLTLMTGIGAVGSVAAYSPLIAFLSSVLSNLFTLVLLPIFSLILVLSIVNNLSSNTKFNKLIDFFKSLFKWIVGFSFSVFFVFFSVQGMSASASDGVSIKTAKFAIKNYVPILGGYVSEGVEVVKAGMFLIKNAVGFVGVILTCSTIVLPLISIAVFTLSLKFLAGVLEPVGNGTAVNILSAVSDSFKLLLTCLLVVFCVFVLTLFLMICSVSGAVIL